MQAHSIWKSLLPLLLLFPLFGAVAHAQTISPKRVYLANDDHTDYLWTADEATYRAAFLEMIDFYLNLADTTQNNPPTQQSRFNCDGYFWLWEYEKNKSVADFQRLINRIKDGHLSAPLNALVSCYGGAPAEATLRGMYYPGRLERRYNMSFPLAVAMENQTLPYGLGTLWAGAGAKYSWRGICGCVSRVPSPEDREHDIYWWQGMDGSRILMKWNSMLQGNQSIGGYAEARDPVGVLNYITGNAAFQQRYPYDILGAFGKGWDDLKTLTNEFVTVAQQQSNASRQVIVSNETDFFQDFESVYGASLPTVSASLGNEWELYCASMAEPSARVKRATEKLRAAEALATLVALKNPAFLNGRDAARDLAFLNLGLYWEHDWTGDGPVPRESRAQWQLRTEAAITSYVNTLHEDARTALGNLILKNPFENRPRFWVFNPLGWTRTDYADFPYADTNPAYVNDLTTGLEVPSQIVTINGQRILRILASDVPSVGYKVFEIQSGTGTNWGNSATVTGSVVDNGVYGVTVADRGAITGWIDHGANNTQMAKNVGGRWINDMGAGTGTLTLESQGAVSTTLKAVSSSPLAHTTRITLYRNSRRIDIQNDITQNFSNVRTWGFGFNLNSPDVQHEEVGAVIRAKLTTNGGHYSPRNARYDWLTLNHYADMTGGTLGVTLSNADCYYFQLGNSTTSTLDTATSSINPLIGGQVDGTNLGIQNQHGDTQFLQRFALRTHGSAQYTQRDAMKFALEHQNPFVTGAVTGSGNTYPETNYSAFSLNDQNVMLWALKPAEEGIGKGVIARVWNLGTAPATPTFTLNPKIASAKRTTHIETDIEPVAVTNGTIQATVGAKQMLTFRLLPNAIVSGKVILQGNLYPAFTPITLTFFQQGGGSFTRTAYLWTDGTITVSDIPRDVVTVQIKASNWISRRIPADTSNGSLVFPDVTLKAGDANEDNAVDISDLLALIGAYNQTFPAAGYLMAADFTRDNTVDIADLLLLIGNYNQQGE